MSLLAEPPPVPTRYRASVADYLAIDSRRQVEYVDGWVEFLEVATYPHQRLAKWLLYRLDGFVTARGLGEAFPPPLPVATVSDRWREPDVFFATPEQSAGRDYADNGVSLVIEVVSPDDRSRKRDLVEKRAEYAAAGIPEYWIVDPDLETVTVLTLPEGTAEYAEHGVFAEGETATSLLLEGFAVDVSGLFAAAAE